MRPDPDSGPALVDLTLLLVQTSAGRILAPGVVAAAWQSDASAFSGMDAENARVEPPATCIDEVKRHWQGVLRYDGTRHVIPVAIDGLP